MSEHVWTSEPAERPWNHMRRNVPLDDTFDGEMSLEFLEWSHTFAAMTE